MCQNGIPCPLLPFGVLKGQDARYPLWHDETEAAGSRAT